MKKLSLMMMALCAAWMVQSCGGHKTDSTAKADSANSAKMSDTTKGTAITTDSADAKYAVNAADGGMAEVALAKLAQQKTSNAKIKEFADMMVTDHSKANDELMALAKSKNITLPATVSADNQKAMDDLSKKSGADFDKAYVNMMVDGHKKAADLFDDESKNGNDPDLKVFAAKTLPTIKVHLTHIQDIQNGMK